MNKIDYQALREAAEKATCGAWSLEYGEERFDAGDALIHREVVGYLPICRIEGAHPESGFDEDFQMEQQANAEFIAAANPATVLALLDENESMCRDLIARNGEIEGLRKLVAELEAAKSKLNEQREYYEGVIADGSKHIAELEKQCAEWERKALSNFEECAAMAERIEEMSKQSCEARERDLFESWVMHSICISKSTLEGLRTETGYRNATLSGTDFNRMWKQWKSIRAAGIRIKGE